MRRLLITGSRMWDNWDIIYHALAAEWLLHTPGSIILVSGNCPPRRDGGPPGADYMCEYYWDTWGGQVERYPAQWKQNGVVNRAAGFDRNYYMAGLPDIYKCLAFQLDGSEGTANCMDCASRRCIPINLYERWSVTV